MENSVSSILEHTAKDGNKYQIKNNDRKRNQNELGRNESRIN